ncbi:MAG: GpE family phage tail protein [Caulobacteraceae bacterium]|nr:GpE family phage tail protein [Caulobacteraceae bacterium]
MRRDREADAPHQHAGADDRRRRQPLRTRLPRAGQRHRRFFHEPPVPGEGWPVSVDEIFSIIAAVYHWPEEAMDRWTVAELLTHQARAVKIWNQMHGGKTT